MRIYFAVWLREKFVRLVGLATEYLRYQLTFDTINMFWNQYKYNTKENEVLIFHYFALI